MPKTPGKMHIYDMVKNDTIVFEIFRRRGGFYSPSGLLAVCNIPDRVNDVPISKATICVTNFKVY